MTPRDEAASLLRSYLKELTSWWTRWWDKIEIVGVVITIQGDRIYTDFAVVDKYGSVANIGRNSGDVLELERGRPSDEDLYLMLKNTLIRKGRTKAQKKF